MKILPINNSLNFKSKLPPASSKPDGWDELASLCNTKDEKQSLEESMKNLAFNGDNNILALERFDAKDYDYYCFRLYGNLDSLNEDRKLGLLDPFYDKNKQVFLAFSKLNNEYTQYLGTSAIPAKRGKFKTQTEILLKTLKKIVTKDSTEYKAIFDYILNSPKVEDTISKLRIKG